MIYAVLFVLAATFVNAADTTGTTSVLTGTPTPADTTATTTQTAATTEVPAAVCEAKTVKLAPWTVRRLNRVADRQARAAARAECCCKDSCCKEKCCCADRSNKVLVVESRRANCNCR